MTPRPHARTERPLAAPLLVVNLADEVARLKQEQDWAGGRRTITLAKERGLRAVLVAMRAGVTLDQHVTAGAVAVQVLEGRVQFKAGEEARTLAAHELLVIEPGLPHDVQALDESVFLLTIAQPDEK